MQRKLRLFLRATIALFATMLSPWNWSVARKRQNYAEAVRAAVAVAAICAVLIVPMVMSAGVHFTRPALECAAFGCGVVITVIGTIAVSLLCAGLATPAVVACDAIYAA